MARQHDLVIVAYHPQRSQREKHLQKSQALSYAAKESHKRRQHTRGVEVYRPKTPIKDTRKPPQTLSLGILQYGNSDPFDTANLKLTPEVSSLLSIWRSHVVSADNKPSEPLNRQGLDLDFSFTDSVYSKLVVVACSAIVLLRASHNSPGSVERKSKCLSKLHALISSSESREAQVAENLHLMFMTLLFLNEVEEARRCLPFLNGALTYLKRHDPALVMFLTARTLVYDWQTAIMGLRPLIHRTGLIMSDWAVLLEPSRQWSTARLPAPTKISSLFFTDTLVRCFRRLQGFVDFECEGFDDNLVNISPLAQAAALIEPVDLWSILLGHWIECHDRLLTITGPARCKLQNEVVACVAAIGFISGIRFGPKILSIRELAWKCMAALRRLLSDFQPPGIATPVYRDTWVWACYIGALWEYEAGFSRKDSWFIKHLSQKVGDCGISSWTELKYLVDTFVRVPVTYKPGVVTFFGMNTSPGTSESSATESLSSMVFDGSLWDLSDTEQTAS
jgi:hypothetical protein